MKENCKTWKIAVLLSKNKLKSQDSDFHHNQKATESFPLPR